MARVYVHPLPVRIWHWINAFGFVIMILTGFQIRYVGLVELMPFRSAVLLHNGVGFVLIGNFFIWLVFYLFSDKIRVYHPDLSPTRHFLASIRQMRFYGYGIFKGEPNPHHISAYRKFNAMQSMAYQVMMLLLVPLQFYTGLLLWDVERFTGMIDVLGGVTCCRYGARSHLHLLRRIHLHSSLPCEPRSHADGALQGDDLGLRRRRGRARNRVIPGGYPLVAAFDEPKA